ncbi:IPT/TIG domain-containing protein [Flagellimonas myxillae]|uniref:IPT/TIG domain-containing protein n=1 Tax=Flagellimonas myxillae TaxID=2942214 RepID=UPI00201FAF32|nr:IPT/TIG domain-containing protein [Muricauda myxillae]MCL6264996.1 IPT/TIG domain-containing protein [Muricauda myxillae]
MGKKAPHYFHLLIFSLLFMACDSETLEPDGPGNHNPPYISSFSPTEGKVGKTTVNISGGNFVASADEITVKFDGVVAEINSVSSDGIEVVVPENAETGRISLSSENSIGFSAKDFVIIETPEPKIKKFEPFFGAPGTEVTLFGKDFGASPEDNLVKFNGIEAEVTKVTSDGLKVIVPEGDVHGPITVRVDEVTGTSSYNFGKEITFESFSPAESFAGQIVTLTGSNFLFSIPLSIHFNDLEATILSITETGIEVQVPQGVTDGPITLASPGQSFESDKDFLVTPAPSIDTFDPMEGPAGTKVTITGTEFDHGTVSVLFDGVEAEVTASSDVQIDATVPMGATTGQIEVSIGGQFVTSAENFIVIPPPVIETIEPMQGTPGTEVTITGSGFSHGALTVEFNSTAAVISDATDTSITVTVPDGCETGPITVDVAGQTTQSESDFEVIEP